MERPSHLKVSLGAKLPTRWSRHDSHKDSSVPSQRPKSFQMISTTSDAPYVTCDYTCGHRGQSDGKDITCGSTNMKFGAKSNVLDAAWVDSVDTARCFVSATDPTV